MCKFSVWKATSFTEQHFCDISFHVAQFWINAVASEGKVKITVFLHVRILSIVCKPITKRVETKLGAMRFDHRGHFEAAELTHWRDFFRCFWWTGPEEGPKLKLETWLSSVITGQQGSRAAGCREPSLTLDNMGKLQESIHLSTEGLLTS